MFSLLEEINHKWQYATSYFPSGHNMCTENMVLVLGNNQEFATSVFNAVKGDFEYLVNTSGKDAWRKAIYSNPEFASQLHPDFISRFEKEINEANKGWLSSASVPSSNCCFLKDENGYQIVFTDSARPPLLNSIIQIDDIAQESSYHQLFTQKHIGIMFLICVDLDWFTKCHSDWNNELIKNILSKNRGENILVLHPDTTTYIRQHNAYNPNTEFYQNFFDVHCSRIELFHHKAILNEINI